ncbi:MAG: DUF309 domain-containing protein [Ignavibacteriae bacterium]|nr:DUF309 domain-containing protein [Ignavibacteria bacterium]MBI3364882.1 DUF309 domain-containing protein [Ignavibacteriota bacterium]
MSAENQFRRGIDEFNRGYYFECHDTLEDLWHETRGPDRLFLQGLIQVSVGFYHFFNGNYKGAASQFTRGLAKLDAYRPSHKGVELEEFTRSVVHWLMMAEHAIHGEHVTIDESKIPKVFITATLSLKENSYGDNDN